MSDLEYTPQEPDQNSIPQAEPVAPGPDLRTRDPAPSSPEPAELFLSFTRPEAVPPARIPHLGDLALLAAFLFCGFVCMMAALGIALHFHYDGVSNLDQIKNNVHYLLGTETILYLVALVLSFFVFPRIWNKSFLCGIHWRGAAALRLGLRLPALSLGCFILALLDESLLPGPAHAPIDDIFHTPGAAWLMFAFGVTVAPFCEEVFFRGFLLPTLATAWDWTIERNTGKTAPSLDSNGHPQWSIPAMVAASIATSVPFALMHAEQTGHSLGPFLLLVTVSLILCAVRLKTRSLAASTLVHACYNFLIFSTMLIGTGGFRHLDKL
jgi:uncharacterized protein